MSTSGYVHRITQPNCEYYNHWIHGWLNPYILSLLTGLFLASFIRSWAPSFRKWRIHTVPKIYLAQVSSSCTSYTLKMTLKPKHDAIRTNFLNLKPSNDNTDARSLDHQSVFLSKDPHNTQYNVFILACGGLYRALGFWYTTCYYFKTR